VYQHSSVGKMPIIEVWVSFLIVKILPGYSMIKYVMLLALLDIKRKFQTTDTVITNAPLSGMTMDQPAEIMAIDMEGLLVTLLMVLVNVLVLSN
jgi:hypothetical protein